MPAPRLPHLSSTYFTPSPSTSHPPYTAPAPTTANGASIDQRRLKLSHMRLASLPVFDRLVPMGHRHSTPRLPVVDGEAPDHTDCDPSPTSPRNNRRNKLQKPPGPGGHSVLAGGLRRLSFLDAASSPKQRPNRNGSFASLDSVHVPLPTTSSSNCDTSGPSSDASGQLSRRPTLTSSYGASDDGIDELSSPAPAADSVALLRRKSLLRAAPPGTASRQSGPARNRRNSMPANSLDRVLETDIQRCTTPSGISVIGAFKRGSLRITNGCVSPAPSSTPNSPKTKPDIPRRSLDSILDLAPRNSWESTRSSTTVRAMVEDVDRVKLQVPVQDYIRAPTRPPPPPPPHHPPLAKDPAAPVSDPGQYLSSLPVNTPLAGTSPCMDVDAKYTLPRLTIRHVHDDALDALEGRASNHRCNVKYYDSPPRAHVSGNSPLGCLHTCPDALSEIQSLSSPMEPLVSYSGSQEKVYTFEESVVTRREISRTFPGRRNTDDQCMGIDLVQTDYTVSSRRVTLLSSSRGLQEPQSTNGIPGINSGWTDGLNELKPLQPQMGTPPIVKHAKVQDIPVDSKITGQEYYQRFSRRRSQVAIPPSRKAEISIALS